jgi:hypothetical protein
VGSELVARDVVTMVIQVNGKVRDRVEVDADIDPRGRRADRTRVRENPGVGRRQAGAQGHRPPAQHRQHRRRMRRSAPVLGSVPASMPPRALTGLVDLPGGRTAGAPVDAADVAWSGLGDDRPTQGVRRPASSSAPIATVLARLLLHELVHVRQWRDAGPVRFLARYLGDYLRGRLRGETTTRPIGGSDTRSRLAGSPAVTDRASQSIGHSTIAQVVVVGGYSQIEGFERCDQNRADDEVPVPLAIRRHDVPRRMGLRGRSSTSSNAAW